MESASREIILPLECDIVKTKVNIRYVSGREEQFEIELYGGSSAENRLKEFSQDPTILLRTDNEVVIIPATAIERITFPLPDSEETAIALPGVRKGKRVK